MSPAAYASQEIIWILKLLEDLNLPQKQPITLYENNNSYIKIIETNKQTKKHSPGEAH